MGKKKKPAKGWKMGLLQDRDEDHIHVTPVSENESVNVPSGVWVDVPGGMVLAPGTYTDDHGVLRSIDDMSCVVWHHVCAVHPRCERKGIQPNEIEYTQNGAPWCPDCFWKAVQCSRVDVGAQDVGPDNGDTPRY